MFESNFAMVSAPLILGRDLKISDQNNSGGGTDQKIKWGGVVVLNLRGNLKF